MSPSYQECNGPYHNATEFEELGGGSNCDGFFNPCTNDCYRWMDGFRSDDFNNLWIEPHATIIYGVVYPLLVALTILANIFVVIVLTRPHMRTPTNVILLYMAVADLFVALVPFPFLVIFFTFGFNKETDQIETWWCYMAHYTALDVLPPLCHNVAIWLTVILAAQRLIYLQVPLKAVQVCNTRNVNVATLLVIIVAFLGNVPRFMDVESYRVFNYKVKSSYGNQSIIAQSQLCIYRYTGLVRSLTEQRYFLIYYWFRVIMFVSIPSIALIVLTTMLILGINRAKQRRYLLLSQKQSRVAPCTSVKDHTTIMLVLIVLVFLAVNLPQGLILTIFMIQQTFYAQHPFINNRYMAIGMMVDNVLILATYPLNFAIYCSMSAIFRDTFRSIFCGGSRVARDTTAFSFYSQGNGTNARNGKTSTVNEPTEPPQLDASSKLLVSSCDI